jgi:(p)ppGpp synthase/HD superfamily hydrolase
MPRPTFIPKNIEIENSDIVAIAKNLATKAHAEINQKRKWIIPEVDYIVHPGEVASDLKDLGASKELQAAAWLHDAVEDTNLTLEEIEVVCGSKIAVLVDEVTDKSIKEDGGRAERKVIDKIHASTASRDGQLLKMIDMKNNAPSITMFAPEFALIWLKEKMDMILVLNKLTKEEKAGSMKMLLENKTRAESHGLNEWLKKTNKFSEARYRNE